MVLPVLAGVAILAIVWWARRAGAVAWTTAAVTGMFLADVRLDLWPRMRGPFPWPREWQWEHAALVPKSTALATVAALTILACIVAAAVTRSRPWTLAAIGTIATVAGFTFQLALLNWVPPEGWTQTLIERTRSAVFTLYFTVALGAEADDPGELIANYDQLMLTFPVHARAHPPGPVLFYRGLTRLAAGPGGDRRDEAVQREAALGGALLLVASAVLTWLPIAAVMFSVTRAAGTAIASALIWLFCPGPQLFAPLFDQFAGLLVAIVFALVVIAGRQRRRPAVLALACLAGVVGGVGLDFTFGVMPMIACALLMGFVMTPWQRRDVVAAGVSWLTGFVAVLAVPAVLFDYPFLAVMRTALQVHYAAYTAPRSYSLWLRFDLLDFAIFFGVPLVTFALWRLIWRPRSECAAIGRAGLVMAAAVILLADLSGSTRGEVGRVWIPFMPLLFAPVLMLTSQDHGDRNGPLVAELAGLGVLCALCCVLLRLYWAL